MFFVFVFISGDFYKRHRCLPTYELKDLLVSVCFHFFLLHEPWFIISESVTFTFGVTVENISDSDTFHIQPAALRLLNFIRPSQRLRRILFKIFRGWNKTWKTEVENEKKKDEETCSDSLPSWILQPLRLLTFVCLLISKSEIGHRWSTWIPFSFIPADSIDYSFH